MTFPIDLNTLAELLEPHLGARVTITPTNDGVLLSDPLPAKLTIAMTGPGLFTVGAGFMLDETPLSAAFSATNAVNLGGEALGSVAVIRDDDQLHAFVTTLVHGPIDIGDDFAKAIVRVLDTASHFFKVVNELRARAAAMASLDAAMAPAMQSATNPVGPSGPAAVTPAGVDNSPGHPTPALASDPPPFTGYL